MKNNFSELRLLAGTIRDIESAAAILEWDQETYMPSGGAAARAEQIATIRQIGHERQTSERIGGLLDDLSVDDTLSESQADMVRVMRRDYERATKLPKTLVARLSRAVSRAKEAWKHALEEDNFRLFAPHLATLIDLNREKAESLGYSESIYDPLLDEYEPGFPTAALLPLFDELRSNLVELVRAIADYDRPDTSFLHDAYPADDQWDFGIRVIEDFGFDMSRGRQDISAHPFTTSFDITDVRLTTRISDRFFSPAFFGTLHEAGHGLYEQGIDSLFARTPLASGTSLGMHESQSRLWENLVGRSRPFWRHYFPLLRKRFGRALTDVSETDFYRAVNHVSPSLIRVESDELTYNLHIMLRVELEIAMLQGDLPVDAVPEAWNERMQQYLGVTPSTDRQGALQDIHWALGTFGYFPTYTLGNLMSVQLFNKANADIPAMSELIRSGQFEPLLEWLRENVHRYGRSRSAGRILSDACGEPLSAEPWLEYVREKYSGIYGPL